MLGSELFIIIWSSQRIIYNVLLPEAFFNLILPSCFHLKFSIKIFITLTICYGEMGSLLMCIAINCAYVLSGHHSFSSEMSSFLIIRGGARSRATDDGIRVLSLSVFFASDFFLLWLYFQTKFFPLVMIFDMARSILISYLLSNSAGKKIHISFQKSSCRLLILHPIGQGRITCPSLTITITIQFVMLWNYRQSVEWRWI